MLGGACGGFLARIYAAETAKACVLLFLFMQMMIRY